MASLYVKRWTSRAPIARFALGVLLGTFFVLTSGCVQKWEVVRVPPGMTRQQGMQIWRECENSAPVENPSNNPSSSGSLCSAIEPFGPALRRMELRRLTNSVVDFQAETGNRYARRVGKGES